MSYQMGHARFLETTTHECDGVIQDGILISSIPCHATIRIDPLGNCTLDVALDFQEWVSVRMKSQIPDANGNRSLSSSEMFDFTGVELKLDCEHGTYTAKECYPIRYESTSSETDTSSRIRLRPQIMIYERKNISDPEIRYWQLPLINYASKFNPATASVSAHPLFLESEMPLAVDFSFEQDLAFIQPLPEFTHQVQRLAAGENAAVTAILVGQRNLQPIDRPFDWIPLDILQLLGMVIGNQVGFSWIEMANVAGEIVQCVYANTLTPSFVPGHSVVISPNSISKIIESFLVSSLFGKTEIRFALEHLSRAGLGNRMLNETLYQLCLTIELLCKYQGVDTVNLLKQVDSIRQPIVKSMLQGAATSIRNEMNNTLDVNEKSVLETIANRARSSADTDRNFGLALVELTTAMSLPDAEIAGKFYSLHPTAHTSWVNALNYYRGAIAHSGIFETTSGKASAKELWALNDHMHDIAVRVILKLIGYQDKYQPSMMPSVIIAEENVDWVTSKTPAASLGYRP